MLFNIIRHLIDVGQTEFIKGSVKILGLSITKINVSSAS